MNSSEKTPPDDQINILVTGFAPFYDNSLVNSSWEIARKLPPHLPGKIFTSGSKDDCTTKDLTESSLSVRIFVHPEPIKVSYKAVRELVPKLLGSRKIDLVLHIGLASHRDFYSIERRAHRDGYLMPDVDGMGCPDLTERITLGKDWIWYGLPEEIVSDIDIDNTWKQWQVLTPGVDVRISDDPGRFLCDFIYYTSLAELTKKGVPKKVIFLHVPKETDVATINTGLNVTNQLIRAIIQTELQNRNNSPSNTISSPEFEYRPLM